MHVFYQPDLTPAVLVLDEEESKHAARVLRLQKGDEVHLADGKGTHAKGVITDANPKKCVLEIREREMHPVSRTYRLHIVIAPTKNADRIEWFIEKAVECGIDEISFVETRNSERTKVNLERCRKIAVSAMKQSKQWWLPEINEVRKLEHLLPQLPAGKKLVAWCEVDPRDSLRHALEGAIESIVIMIGPEGDFTKEEVAAATAAGFHAVSLGDSILRTETAALYVCMAAKALLG